MREMPVWHAIGVDGAFYALDVEKSGLSTAEAAERRSRFGPNLLTVRSPDPVWRVLLRQFQSLLIVILLIAVAITLVLQHWVDAAAISIVLLLNAAIGFWQEVRADREVRALASLSTPSCRVLRDGRVAAMVATELVPGDVVLLESGERVPADVRLWDVRALQVDESLLTGESLAASKSSDPVAVDDPIGDRTCMAYSGTHVTSGRTRGLVIATGADTELGLINELVQGQPEPTPLQHVVHRLERAIGIVVGIVAAAIVVGGVALGEAWEEVFLSAVAVAVASIPEALPVVLTIALALGVRRMARRNAVVRTLPAVETLGSTSIIASDKTGTLTQNLLTVERVWTAAGIVDLPPSLVEDAPVPTDTLLHGVLIAGALANESHRNSDSPSGFVGDAVDIALARAAVALGLPQADIDDELEEVAHLPYEPVNGYSQSLRRRADGRLELFVKGAPDVVAPMATSLAGSALAADGMRAAVAGASADLAADGYRVLALAHRVLGSATVPGPELPHPSGLMLLGLAAMTDPPRPGVREAIADCRHAGIDLIMVTGDHPVTASTIAARLGIPDRGEVLTGAELAELDDDALRLRLRSTSVAARVSPADKLRIVEALRADGETVAVTGDGVNDAPALRAASIGVAMGAAGTDVAREAADVVLADDDFVTIVHAVREGRVTFAAIRKATFFLLSTGFAIMVAVTLSVYLEAPVLLLPVQVLWINVVTNGLQDVALAFEPGEGGELRRPPRPATEGILSTVLWGRVIVTGLWMAAAILLAFLWALENGYDLDHARTLTLTLFVLFNFFQSGSARAEHRSLFVLSPLSNPFLLLTAVGSLLLQWGAMTWPVSAELLSLVPLTLEEWLACAVIGSTVLVIVELEKLVRRVISRRRGSTLSA